MYDGEIVETKLLWAFGNFSRFVRPGMVRIEASVQNDLSLPEQARDLQVAAFKDNSRSELVLVLINHQEKERKLSIGGIAAPKNKVTMYVTDESRDLEKITVHVDEITMPKRSVSTLIVNID
jgi:alpha-L-arabinofuranosidase